MVEDRPALTCLAPLFVPGHRPERFAKAAASSRVIIIDLEDAVPPEAKEAARASLRQEMPPDTAVLVRINGRRTPWHEADLVAIGAFHAAGIILPKVEAPEDIRAIGVRHTVIALIETAAGVGAVRTIARDGRAVRLAFGSVDFCAELGCDHSRDALLLARSEIVLASRMAGLAPPLDGVTLRFDDPALVEDDARYAASLGFGGKLCIHPAQIGPALKGFAPTEDEIAWARTVLESASDGGAVAGAGMMIDPPVRARAERILIRAAWAV